MSPTTTRLSLKASDIPIQSVTVFRSQNAQIVRIVALDLKEGRNEIEITGLSSAIDTESLRISGIGGDAQLADVLCTLDATPNNADSNQTLPIQDAHAKMRDFKFEKEAREAEVDMLFRYGEALGALILPEQVLLFAKNLTEKKLAVAEEVKRLKAQILELETFIKRSKQPIIGEARAKATIVIVAGEEGATQLTVSYLVQGASWRPTYDLHAKSENGRPSSSVVLYYRVHLSQRTGEHWNDTLLIFSTTATDSLNAGIPTPKALEIKAVAPPTDGSGQERSRGQGQHEVLQNFFQSLLSIKEPAAFVTKSPVAVNYQVEGKSTIPSDGHLHKVSVAQLPFEAAIARVIVSRREVLAYLQCKVKNTTDYHLLPGPVSVFMDDGYVSKTSILDINTGDMFRCTLGVDTSTRVSYSLTSTTESSQASSFVEQYKTTTYTSTTTIHSRHKGQEPIFIVEKSSVPVAPQDDGRIKVFLKQPAGLAESEDGVEVDLKRSDGFKVKWSSRTGEGKELGKRKGKFVWLGSIAPGEHVTLVSEWEVRAPVDVDWIERSS